MNIEKFNRLMENFNLCLLLVAAKIDAKDSIKAFDGWQRLIK